MDRWFAQRRSLKNNPPADFLIAGYFQAQGWWAPPGDTQSGSGEMPVEWSPDVEEFVP